MPFNMRWWTLSDFQKHIAGLTEAYYTSKGRAPPVIHTIGYRICRDGNDFLRELSSANRGSHRRVGAYASYSDADRAR